jgi:hypothetical protein
VTAGVECVEAGRPEIERDGALGTREAPKVALLARPAA